MNKYLAGQVKEALKYGAREFELIRRQNELLQVQADAFQTIKGLIELTTKRGGYAAGIDAAWNFRRLLEEIEKAEEMERVENLQPENPESGRHSASGETGRPTGANGEGASDSPSAFERSLRDAPNTSGVGSVGQQLGEAASGPVSPSTEDPYPN